MKYHRHIFCGGDCERKKDEKKLQIYLVITEKIIIFVVVKEMMKKKL